MLNIDLAGTIADMAGVRPGLRQDGLSLVPLLAGRKTSSAIGLRGEFLGYVPGVPPYQGVRTRRHLYVEYRNDARELYDLRRDPDELRNLLHGPQASDVTELTARLEAMLERMAR